MSTEETGRLSERQWQEAVKSSTSATGARMGSRDPVSVYVHLVLDGDGALVRGYVNSGERALEHAHSIEGLVVAVEPLADFRSTAVATQAG